MTNTGGFYIVGDPDNRFKIHADCGLADRLNTPHVCPKFCSCCGLFECTCYLHCPPCKRGSPPNYCRSCGATISDSSLKELHDLDGECPEVKRANESTRPISTSASRPESTALDESSG